MAIVQLANPKALKAWREALPGTGLGFVPTMGALHDGHSALIRKARAKCDQVVVSIYVNPTQFNDPKDLDAYPRTLEADLEMAIKAGATAVFTPAYSQLYPDGYTYRVTENALSRRMEGAHRPGHFDGVLSVVLKLLNLVQPTCAYFGLKDYQQFRLISVMAEAFFLPMEIVGVETVREADGLALSSRNVHLSAEGRALVPQFVRILRTSRDCAEARKALEALGFEVDYVEDHEGRRLGAIHTRLTRTGTSLRLIDNVALTEVREAGHAR